MNIHLLSPAPDGYPSYGVTAHRWAQLLAAQGHDVLISPPDRLEPCDLLIALGAVACATAVNRAYRHHPRLPVVVALTTHDLAALPRQPAAASAVELASRLVVFQPLAVSLLPPHLRAKAGVVFPAAAPLPSRVAPRRDSLVVTVAAPLESAIDPLRAACAARLLPTSSRIRIEHFGAPIDESLAHEARRAMVDSSHYHWGGALPYEELRQRLAASHAVVVSHSSDARETILAEAAADRVPVIASRIPAHLGILGPHYPAYFDPGDTPQLAALLHQCESSPDFLRQLRAALAIPARNLRPPQEARRWRSILKAIRLPQNSKPSAAAEGA
jgi:hypothetical protein